MRPHRQSVRLTTPVLAALLAVVAALLAAPPAGAGYHMQWEFTDRPPDLPATDDAARIIASASAIQGYPHTGEPPSVVVEVELAGEPDAATDARLQVLFGRAGETGCQWELQRTLSTYQSSYGARREGATVTVTQALSPGQGLEWDCAEVRLTDPEAGAKVLDQLEGHITRTVISDPILHTVRIDRPDDVRVPVGKWRRVELNLRRYVRDVDMVVIRGTGRGIKVQPIVVDVSSRRFTARLPIRLRVDERRRLRVDVSSFEDGERTVEQGAATTVVRIRPRR